MNLCDWLCCSGLCGLALAVTAAASASERAEPQGYRVYIGTYTGGDSRGVYAFELDLKTGKTTQPQLAAEIDSPSFLAVHPTRPLLYAVNEVGNFGGKPSGGVSALGIDAKTGALSLLNQQASGGSGPCHIVVDAAGKNVLVANYGGGSVACLPIGADGRLGEATALIQHKGSSVTLRQQGPHAHSINLDRANRFAFAADLGLDQVLVYRFDPQQGTLTPHDPPALGVAPGSGPRHLAFRPDGRFAYVINELTLTVTAFRYDARTGTLETVQTISTLPEGTTGAGLSTAEVQVHPSGKFLYGSNRGHDTIAVFAIDAESGRLTPIEHEPTGGKTPRNFGIDPSGRFLLAANQNSGTVVVFRIDPDTGRLEPTGEVVQVPRPVCVKFVGL